MRQFGPLIEIGGSMTMRERLYKGAVNGLARRRLTVAAYRFGTQPLIEFRILDQEHGRTDHIDLTLQQTRETLRLLTTALKAAENSACADRTPSLTPDDRALPGEVLNDAQNQAQS